MLAHHVRPEAIWERTSLIVERSGRRPGQFLKKVAWRLKTAHISGMTLTYGSVRIGERFAAGAPSLAVRSERFRDVRLFVVARPAGVHLEVLLLTAIEPGWLKRAAAGLVARGAWWAWSLPDGISRQEELRTLLTLVETVVQSVARKVAARAAGPDGLLPPERSTVLDGWN